MSQNNAKKLNPILDKGLIINELKVIKNSGKGFESLRLHKTPCNSTIYKIHTQNHTQFWVFLFFIRKYNRYIFIMDYHSLPDNKLVF